MTADCGQERQKGGIRRNIYFYLAFYFLSINIIFKAGWCLPRGLKTSSQVAKYHWRKTPSGLMTGRRLISLYMG